jgi:predicted phage terminase large subunit-like protein
MREQTVEVLDHEFKVLLAQLATLPEAQKYQILQDLERRERMLEKEKAQDTFMGFVHKMWPEFIGGRHHKIMAAAFERVVRGECKRLIINMPPRHTKSEFASYLLPAWFLGKYPAKKVIQSSNTGELAVGFGRKVRNLVDSDAYKEIFPNLELQQDSKAAGRWNTSKGGDYFAIGVGGTVTGKGANLLIIDDPHSEQEAALAATNPDVFDKVTEWYTSGPRQRLQPGGAIIIVMCMVGGTDVLMADGTSAKLRDIRPGDMVATFDKGKLTTARVNNWQSNGVDSIHRIQTQSGIILQANERHPFLVLNEGVLEWTRLKNLAPGMLLVATKDALDQPDHKQSRDFARPVCHRQAITEKTPTLLDTQSGIMVSGEELAAPSATNQPYPKGCALPATLSKKGIQKPRSNQERLVSSIGTESRLRSTPRWLRSVVTGVMYVARSLQQRILGHTGTGSSASTMTTLPGESGGSCAMTATLQWGTERQRIFLNALQNTSDFTADPIVSIVPAGEEEVFDVEIDRTENFIANGVVSHNTRWAMRDLTGQVLKAAAGRGGEQWEVIEFPAIMPSGKPLWPEFWSLQELEALRTELPNSKWQAQYQQNPIGNESAIIKRDWWKWWDHERPPVCDYILQTWDTAFEKNNRADYSAGTTWGIFYNDEDHSLPNIVLLNTYKKRVEWIELKRDVLNEYNEWEPDGVLVEKKATGAPLIYELRAMGIPVQEYTPSRGQDKIARLNSVSDIIASGKVWLPRTRWAEELVDEIGAFPSGEHDDLVDATTLALMRFRAGGFLRLPSDEKEEVKLFKRRDAAFY